MGLISTRDCYSTLNPAIFGAERQNGTASDVPCTPYFITCGVFIKIRANLKILLQQHDVCPHSHESQCAFTHI